MACTSIICHACTSIICHACIQAIHDLFRDCVVSVGHSLPRTSYLARFSKREIHCGIPVQLQRTRNIQVKCTQRSLCSGVSGLRKPLEIGMTSLTCHCQTHLSAASIVELVSNLLAPCHHRDGAARVPVRVLLSRVGRPPAVSEAQAISRSSLSSRTTALSRAAHGDA